MGEMLKRLVVVVALVVGACGAEPKTVAEPRIDPDHLTDTPLGATASEPDAGGSITDAGAADSATARAGTYYQPPPEGGEIRGTIEAFEITDDKRYVVNKRFRGRAFMMLNHHPTGGKKETIEPIPDDLYRAIRVLGGDGFYVVISGSENPSGGLLLGNTLLFDRDGTHYGRFRRANSKPRFFRPAFPPYPEFAPQPYTPTIRSNPEDFPYELSKKNKRITFRFDDISFEVTKLKALCPDGSEHKVVLRDGAGGVLRIKDAMEFGVIAHDGDTDGIKELYLLSSRPCARWLRVIKIVPESQPSE